MAQGRENNLSPLVSALLYVRYHVCAVRVEYAMFPTGGCVDAQSPAGGVGRGGGEGGAEVEPLGDWLTRG